MSERFTVRAGWGALLLLLLTLGCAERRVPASVRSRTLWVMGTEASVVLPGSDADRLANAADRVETVFQETESRLSRFRDTSELTAINRQAGLSPVSVSPETLHTLNLALTYARLTGGAFDPTVAPLVALWQAASTAGVPSPATVARCLSLIGYTKVQSDPVAKSVFLSHEGMQLDLGGIAKGTAVDRAAAALLAAGHDRFLIDLGGDIRCQGAPDGQPAWRVGVRDPFDKRQLLGVVRMAPSSAIVTSGNYERFIVVDGQRYGHLIDPRSGYPVRGMAGVTVMADEAGVADAMSTALFVLGMDQATALLARHPGIEAMLIPDRKPLEIWVTPGLKPRFEPSAEYQAAVRLLPI